jgi:hypothetical protein
MIQNHHPAFLQERFSTIEIEVISEGHHLHKQGIEIE